MSHNVEKFCALCPSLKSARYGRERAAEKTKRESACFTLSLSLCQIVPVGCGQGRRLTRRACARLGNQLFNWGGLSLLRLPFSYATWRLSQCLYYSTFGAECQGFLRKKLIFFTHRSGENLSGDIGNQPRRAVLRERTLPNQTAREENAVFARPPTDSHIREEDFPLGGGEVFKDLACAPHGVGVFRLVQKRAQMGKNSNFHSVCSFRSRGVCPLSVSIL